MNRISKIENTYLNKGVDALSKQEAQDLQKFYGIGSAHYPVLAEWIMALEQTENLPFEQLISHFDAL